ncbi:hypothetical protein [Geopsychrobacter electrodiphilus]|uniref:hypothetical protein n=1 Tax=Geopsychrobacter electrodiphilus TaxID=225196 RepID=UPI0012EB734D|nr:hypothetical protein [Geopsychrobacter electrodiphilus]
MKKAEILVKQYREALYLVDDDRRFQAVSTMIISNLISAGIMMFLGVGFFILIFGINFYFPLSGGKLLVTSAVGLMLFLQGVQAASDTMDKRRIAIKPYIDWVGYHEATLARIGSLLATAGLDDGEQAIFINNVVSIVDEEIIGPENDEVDED